MGSPWNWLVSQTLQQHQLLQHSEATGLLGLLTTTAALQHWEGEKVAFQAGLIALLPHFLRQQAVKTTFVKIILEADAAELYRITGNGSCSALI